MSCNNRSQSIAALFLQEVDQRLGGFVTLAMFDPGEFWGDGVPSWIST